MTLTRQAEASCKVLKNKGKITLKMNDILNQDNRYNVSYGGNQRSETWQGHLHHYAEIGFSYTFDAKGK